LEATLATLPPDLTAAARSHKPALLPLLAGDEVTPQSLLIRMGMPLLVTVSGKDYPYVGRWSGQRLAPASTKDRQAGDAYPAFATETAGGDLLAEAPALALAFGPPGGEVRYPHPPH